MDIVTLGAALNGSKAYTDQVTQSLMGGVHYRGSVSYYSDLPNDAAEGDSYTVKYAGTSGTVADGTEYTWGYDTDSQDFAWISFSKDTYSKAEIDNKLVGSNIALTGYTKGTTAKQDVSPADNVNQGLGKIEKRVSDNENNILYNTNQGVKNLFNLTKVSRTYSTVVFTVNSDKTVTVNGTASPANSVFNLDDWTCTKAGTYVISGAPSGGSWAPSPNTYRIRIAVNAVWKGDDVGNGYALTLAVGDVVNLQINTSTSYTASNLVFRPMIALKSLYDADSTYQPYAMSNVELTAKEQANENNISSIQQTIGDINSVLEEVL